MPAADPTAGHLTTPLGSDRTQAVRVTHPFHPRSGEELAVVSIRSGGQEGKVYYYDEQGLRTIPVSWTSLGVPDPAVCVSQGRSWFRVEDLLELTRQIGELKAARRRGGKERGSVKKIMPQM